MGALKIEHADVCTKCKQSVKRHRKLFALGACEGVSRERETDTGSFLVRLYILFFRNDESGVGKSRLAKATEILDEALVKLAGTPAVSMEDLLLDDNDPVVEEVPSPSSQEKRRPRTSKKGRQEKCTGAGLFRILFG